MKYDFGFKGTLLKLAIGQKTLHQAGKAEVTERKQFFQAETTKKSANLSAEAMVKN